MNSEEDNKIIIPLSKRKISLAIIGSVAFVIGGVIILSIADAQGRYSPGYMKFIGYSCIILFGLCLFYLTIKLFDNKPGLIIDREGIVDNASAICAGRIRWDEITKMDLYTIYGQRFIAIKVRNPSKYIDKGGFIKRFLNLLSSKMSYSPINIASNSLSTSFDDLHDMLNNAYSKYCPNKTDSVNQEV